MNDWVDRAFSIFYTLLRGIAALQKLLLWVLIIVVTVSACKPAAMQMGAGMPFEKPDDSESAVAEVDLPLLIDHNALTSADLRHFYTARNFTSAWLTQHRVLPAADSMLLMLSNARLYGLDAEEYNYSAISQLLENIEIEANDKEKLDVFLTDALLTMARHLKSGRFVPNTSRMAPKPATPDSAQLAMLNHAVESNSVRQTLESLEPSHAQYIALKAELAKAYTIL